MDRILIIKLSAFGDIVQAEGAIHDIRNHHPGAEIILMTTPPYRVLMEKCPWVDSVFIDPRESRWRLDRMVSLRNRLRRLKVTRVYDLQQVSRTGYYHRLFLPDVSWDVARNSKLLKDPDFCRKGAMDRFAVHLAEAGIRIRHTLQPDLSWMAEDATALLAGENITGPYVVLIPGSSAGYDEKRWPHYNGLAAWLRGRGREVITVPGPDEMQLCRTLTHATMITDRGRYLNFFELAGVLMRAEFVIGNDTGPTHLAAHLGRPGLALFSGRYFEASRTGIQHSRFSWLEADVLRDLSFDTVREKVGAHFLRNGD
ncbi:MAG: glycosyltransferase family 9 protein [Desulfobulbaceae bacterium]|nr:glycosyltransferase family 9 protein [Desulfobulbaceae bacterium]